MQTLLHCVVKMNCRLDIFHTVWARIASGMYNLFINQSSWRTNLDSWSQCVLCWSCKVLQPDIFWFSCVLSQHTHIYMYLRYIFMLFQRLFICNTQSKSIYQFRIFLWCQLLTQGGDKDFILKAFVLVLVGFFHSVHCFANLVFPHL